MIQKLSKFSIDDLTKLIEQKHSPLTIIAPFDLLEIDFANSKEYKENRYIEIAPILNALLRDESTTQIINKAYCAVRNDYLRSKLDYLIIKVALHKGKIRYRPQENNHSVEMEIIW